MNAKWYFSTLIIALTLLGVCQKQDPVANQEIVMEFIDVQITEEDVQEAIADIKVRLLDVGASNIKVQEAKGGTLKITYHSDVNVTSIKQILSKDSHLVLEYASSHSSKDSRPSDDTSDYNLDVYEIKQGTESSNLGGGKYVLEVKYDYERFTNPNVYFPFINQVTCKLNHSIKTAYKVNRKIAVAIDNTSHKEPEVRAGPNSNC